MAVDPYLFGPEPPCDSAPFFTAGIPSVCHISGPLYLFDPHDTIDKVRTEDLPRVAGLFRELVEAIDLIPASDLQAGLTPRRDDTPTPLPPWFQPPPETKATHWWSVQIELTRGRQVRIESSMGPWPVHMNRATKPRTGQGPCPYPPLVLPRARGNRLFRVILRHLRGGDFRRRARVDAHAAEDGHAPYSPNQAIPGNLLWLAVKPASTMWVRTIDIRWDRATRMDRKKEKTRARRTSRKRKDLSRLVAQVEPIVGWTPIGVHCWWLARHVEKHPPKLFNDLAPDGWFIGVDNFASVEKTPKVFQTARDE